MLKYLLDTNIVIYVIKRRPRVALDRFNREHGHMAVSSITSAELIHGAEKSSDPSRNLAVVEDFVSRLGVLPYGDKAADYATDAIRGAGERLRPEESTRANQLLGWKAAGDLDATCADEWHRLPTNHEQKTTRIA